MAAPLTAIPVRVKRNARDVGEVLTVLAPNEAVARAYAEVGYLKRHGLAASVQVFAEVVR